jgi:hypothetical protein
LDKKKKSAVLAVLLGGALFGRQPLQLNRTAEREAESAADQAPLVFLEMSISED